MNRCSGLSLPGPTLGNLATDGFLIPTAVPLSFTGILLFEILEYLLVCRWWNSFRLRRGSREFNGRVIKASAVEKRSEHRWNSIDDA